jgi:hypothetical protein
MRTIKPNQKGQAFKRVAPQSGMLLCKDQPFCLMFGSTCPAEMIQSPEQTEPHTQKAVSDEGERRV